MDPNTPTIIGMMDTFLHFHTIIIIIINFTTREGIHKRQSLHKVSAQNTTLQKQQRNIYKTTLNTKYTKTNKSRDTKHQLTHI